MHNKQQVRKENNMTRQQFMRDGAAAAAGLVVGIGASGCQSGQAGKLGDAKTPDKAQPQVHVSGGANARLPRFLNSD